MAYELAKIPVEVEVMNGNIEGHERFGKPVVINITCNRFVNIDWKEE